jgi:hypothetical protein
MAIAQWPITIITAAMHQRIDRRCSIKPTIFDCA